jgi:ketosteroid isomerase-like protein
MSDVIVDQLVKLFDVGDASGMVALCRPDALVDVNVPRWRYQIHPDALLTGLRENTEMPGRSVTIGYHEATEDGAVVEVETRGVNDGTPVLIREVWLLRTDGEKITEWINYCTAPWDATTIARQRAEAPMIRR